VGGKGALKKRNLLIKDAKVTFRPGIDLKEMLATLKYEKKARAANFKSPPLF
jgi:hypothetical protein